MSKMTSRQDDEPFTHCECASSTRMLEARGCWKLLQTQNAFHWAHRSASRRHKFRVTHVPPSAGGLAAAGATAGRRARQAAGPRQAQARARHH